MQRLKYANPFYLKYGSFSIHPLIYYMTVQTCSAKKIMNTKALIYVYILLENHSYILKPVKITKKHSH